MKGTVMARYPNGEIPASLLVSRPARDGTCLMMPGTAVKFDRLVALGRERYGWTPVVSGPDDAYRTRPRQQHYWDTLPYPQAAYPGSSSHGGEYQGRESGALDIGNWSEIGQEAFYELARDAGFEPGFFDWEPWHIIDWSPWLIPPTPSPTESEEDDMKETYVWWKDSAGKQQNLIYAIGGNGMHDHWESASGAYNTRNAAAHNLAGPPAEISEGHGLALLAKLAGKR